MFDKSESPNLTLINHFENIEAYDVIPLQTSLLMIIEGTLRQYAYLDDDIKLLSTFNLN